MFEKLDKTIEIVCDRVQRKAKGETFEDKELPCLVSALAELVSARNLYTLDAKKLSTAIHRCQKTSAVRYADTVSPEEQIH